MRRILLTLLALLPGWSTAGWGRTPATSASPLPLAAGVAGFDTNIVWRIHDTGYLRATATNYGYFGTVRERLRDSAGALVPVLESPAHSRIEYMYEAGLWIGGIVGGDTLVSSGSLGFGQSHELYADNYDPPVYSDRLGDDEWTFIYGDTTTDPETVRDDPYDGPHRPLPVRVRQKTYTLGAQLHDGALFQELVITNIGTVPIESLWVGWMCDPDIGHAETEDYWMDDVVGHTRRSIVQGDQSTEVSVAWAADNDGDPDSTDHFDARSPRRMFGSMYLGGFPRLTGESFNWWVPSLRDPYDWGPQRAPGDTNIFGGRGYDVTDAYRYRRMANRELDYAQPYAAVDRSAEGWIAPTHDSIAVDFADGFDIRFLHTVGATTLAPGDSLVVHWVWMVAPYGHTQPLNFKTLFDPRDPSKYLQGLGISQLEYYALDQRHAWDSAFSFLPIAPPRTFDVAGWNDTSGVLTWSARHTDRLTYYRVQRRAGDGSDRRTFSAGLDTSFVDVGLDRSKTYYYTVACMGRPGIIGPESISDSLLPDRPKTPARPIALAQRHEIHLHWPPNAEDDISGYRVYRRAPGGDWELIATTDTATRVTDQDVAGATLYEYRVTALSSLANESYPSPATVGVAFDFDGPPQIFDYTLANAFSLTDRDSTRAVWERLLSGSLYRDFATGDPPLTLVDFDPHPLTVVTADGRGAMGRGEEELLAVYSNARGVTVLSGRDLFNFEGVQAETVAVPAGSLGALAGIRRVYYPASLLAGPTRMNAEFVAAAPADPRLPRLAVDASRTGWGLNPALPHPGNAVPFVGFFEIDTAQGEVLYTFVSRDSAHSPLQGQAVAVRARDPQRTLVVFAFPLSYMDEQDARAALTAILGRMGYGVPSARGDADNDGAVTPADVVFLIDYLYRDGYLLYESAADVNGDCVVDIRDLVYLIDHVTGDVPLPDGVCP
ncbi:MAG TPA: dockerin type I domain-containing protein [bacterium]|nr:dockerin type I domain-containing protein [bacterium]